MLRHRRAPPPRTPGRRGRPPRARRAGLHVDEQRHDERHREPDVHRADAAHGPPAPHPPRHVEADGDEAAEQDQARIPVTTRGRGASARSGRKSSPRRSVTRARSGCTLCPCWAQSRCAISVRDSWPGSTRPRPARSLNTALRWTWCPATWRTPSTRPASGAPSALSSPRSRWANRWTPFAMIARQPVLPCPGHRPAGGRAGRAVLDRPRRGKPDASCGDQVRAGDRPRHRRRADEGSAATVFGAGLGTRRRGAPRPCRPLCRGEAARRIRLPRRRADLLLGRWRPLRSQLGRVSEMA